MVRFISIMLLCCMVIGPAVARETAGTSFVTISGVVKDKDTKKALENVGISVEGSHLGTVSNADGIPRKSAFGNSEIFYDKVTDYWDADFWNGYNIIEPTESLDKAVMKLKRNNAAVMALYP